MRKLRILRADEDPDALRAVCGPVEYAASLRPLLDLMVRRMRASGGCGLAAPQVGRRERLFVFEGESRPEALINPVVEPVSTHSVSDVEGCLSLPGVRAQVSRPYSVQVRGLDWWGQPVERTYSGHAARVIQHETDHLDGVLFVDRADLCTLTG